MARTLSNCLDRTGDMYDRASIVELAALLGIEPHYMDALGQHHEIPNETLLAIIGAFGLPPDPTLARQELGDRERSAPFGLGTVHIVHAEAAHPELALRLPDGCGEIFWECRLESGEERSGRLAPASVGGRFAVPLPAGFRLVITSSNLKPPASPRGSASLS